MNNHQQQSGFHGDQLLWDAAEDLISPDPNLRDSSLDQLKEIDGIHRSPLIAYLLVSRISEPDLEIRFHLIRLLGSLMDFESSGKSFSDQALNFAKDALDQMEKSELIKILEVAESYLTAEKAISNILKLSSYAGVGLNGIVNDRKLPISVRQQAVYYCGKVGYLSSIPTLQNLVQRVDKARTRPGNGNERQKSRDEEFLYPFVISALEKLNS